MSDSPYRDPAVAEVYQRVAMPTHFARPARDLVALMNVAAGDTVLDVGTGTGSFANPASEAAGQSGLVVGVDRAIEMLRASDVRGRHPVIVGHVPGLPFADEVFDAVGASFVLPHCRDYSSALVDIARVCRPGGRVGITAWGPMPNVASWLWKRIVDTFVDADQLQQAFRAIVPWEEYFHVPGNLERALEDARLTAIHVETREYTIDIPSEDYLRMKKAGVEGRLIRQLAGEIAWDQFTRRISEDFRKQFTRNITFVRDVHFGVGRK